MPRSRSESHSSPRSISRIDVGSKSRERRKEADRIEEEAQNADTCLYIGNIDKKVDGEQLTDIFKKYGELDYCYIIYEPSSSDRATKEAKISRGYGFVRFKFMEDTIRAKN